MLQVERPPLRVVSARRSRTRPHVKIAENRFEREESLRLVYHEYRRVGLIDANPYDVRVTPYHLLSSTAIIAAVADQEVTATVTLVMDGELGVPMESIFPDEIEWLRDQGVSFAEVSCLANGCRDRVRAFPLFLSVNRLMAQYARRQGAEKLVIAVHPRHAAFYRRYMGFRELADEQRSYPAVCNRPAVALVLDFEEIDRTRPPIWEHAFGEPAKPWELAPRPMSDADWIYFAPAVEYSNGSFVPLAG